MLTHRMSTWWSLLRPQDYLFVISHMRSFSSLLSHILGSHPQIAGSAEMQRSYRRHKDLLKLKWQLLTSTETPHGCKLLLDKILHDHLLIADAVLARRDLQVVFLLRKPADTIKSTISMGRSSGKPSWYSDPQQVKDYYTHRLERMVSYAGKVSRKPLFIDSEGIVDRPREILEGLTRKLGLSTPLRQEYRVFTHTGLPGFGDPSGFIKRGMILQERHDYGSIQIEAAILEQAGEAYERCRASLRALCDCL